MKTFNSALNKAILRRDQMSLKTNAVRLVNGAGDDLEGLLIDHYHRHFHVQILSGHWHQQTKEIFRALASLMPVEYLIVKYRRGLDSKEEALTGSDPKTMVEEHGIKFEVNLNDGLNCGLFLDMRQNRWMVGQAAKGKKVLNCFSYTCSFGVHARLGGAREVINTDISRKILERGKNNYELNALLPAPGEFVKVSSIDFLERALKKGNSFDMIILDPPSFARHDGKVFQVKHDLPKLMALSIAVLNPGGHLLVTSNYSEISFTFLEAMLAKSLNSRRVAKIQRLGQDKDFIGSNTFKESYLVGLWARFL